MDSGPGVVVGGRGGLPPELGAVLDAVRSLPTHERDQLVLTTLVAEPDGGTSLAQQVADALDQEVRVQHGILTRDPDGTSQWTATDGDGRPSWRPFSQLCVYRPGSSPVTVERWNQPYPEAEPAGPACFRLTADWVLDVVPAGLLARPADVTADLRLGRAPTHPERADLIVDARSGSVIPDPVVGALARAADRMVPDARSRLRVVLTAGVDPRSERALRLAIPAPQVRHLNPP